MLSGVKFLSKDEISKGKAEEELDDSRKGRGKSSRKKSKERRKHKSRYSSSEDDGLEKIRKRSKKKKWYSSEEYSSSQDEDESGDSSDGDERKGKLKKKKKRKDDDGSEDEGDARSSRKSTGRKKKHSPEEYSSDEFESEKGSRSRRREKRKSKHHGDEKEDDSNGKSEDGINIVRREMGLEWMLPPGNKAEANVESIHVEQQEQEEPTTEEKVNPRELNPYLRNSGSGYPEEENQKTSQDRLLASSLVGDGGASWRLKALKRAKEQAEREGRKLDDVAEERWGSLGHLAVSVSSRSAAPSRAHLHAIRSRKFGQSGEHDPEVKKHDKDEQRPSRDYLKDVSLGRPEMRAPKIDDSLLWKRKKGQKLSNEDADLISSTVSSLNKFASDGSFMNEVTNQQKRANISIRDAPSKEGGDSADAEPDLTERRPSQDKQQTMSANQLAAKALQLRMKGKHEEAQKLLKEAEGARADEVAREKLNRMRNQSSASRHVMRDLDAKQKQKEDDSDVHLAQRIMRNKQFIVSGQADDEYDFDEGPSRKSRKRDTRDDRRQVAKQGLAKRIVTQQERCLFCFENPKRPKHLVVAIANFTYLMLPQRQPLVPGHCCILPLQHESASRSVDDNVWEEIRNFKKCLIMMFSKQEKDVVFLETVMGLAQQRRHCLIECIPVPQDVAKEAPLYFKKAIDEAEEEWSQHNSKRLIDTSQKGLRGSIPKNFPYFHVEFGLKQGFVHVIDDETQFKSSLGLNVIRGMLELPEEDMYRRRRYEAVQAQTQAVAEFAKEWEPFDWTRQL